MNKQTKQDLFDLAVFFAVMLLIVILSIACGTANGAEVLTSRSGVTLDGIPYWVSIQSNGSFDRVDYGGETVARSAHWSVKFHGQVVEGYCFRSNYQYVRLAVLRSILPDSTANLGTWRKRLYVNADEYWQLEREKKETKDETRLKEIQSRQCDLSTAIEKYEAKIYDSLPALQEALDRGDLDPELRTNGADHEFASRIIKGALRSVKKRGDFYRPTDEADSER